MKIYNHLTNSTNNHTKFVVLIDPDRIKKSSISSFIKRCEQGGVDAFFIGGSLMLNSDFNEIISLIKLETSIPLIIFPGDPSQISKNADAILFLSLVSGRNPEYLIGNQVMSAPKLKKIQLETISTAYILIESGKPTSVEFVSNTKPIPRDKIDIAVAHAMASEILGFKLLYLEAGSGAKKTVPNKMITQISKCVSIPIIVGGGISTPKIANEKSQAGAKIIVIGNYFENDSNMNLLKEFSDAIHN